MQNYCWVGFLISLMVAAQEQAVVPATNEPIVDSELVAESVKPDDSQKPENDLDQILADWEKAASKIRRLDGEFSRFTYDKTFDVEKRGEGTIAIESPQRARYRVVPAILAPGAVAKKAGKGGNRFSLKADAPECWHWTETQVIRLDDQERTYEAIKITPHSGVDWGYNSFFLAKPFLLGMPAAELQKQFKVAVLKDTTDEVWLTLIPRDIRIAANLTKATLILNRRTWLAKAVKITDPTGAESVHVFKNMCVNSRTTSADDLSKPNLEGYRQVLNDKPPKTAPPE